MAKYVVMGFEFQDKKSADIAKYELDTISVLREKNNMQNPEMALAVYNKIINDNLFRTPVGMEYLRGLQIFLTDNETIDNSRIKPIKAIMFEQSSNMPKVKELTERDKKRIGKEFNKKLEKISNEDKIRKNARFKEKFVMSFIVNVALVIVIAAMFAIAKKSERFDEQAYREKINNEYVKWEEDLKRREEKLNSQE